MRFFNYSLLLAFFLLYFQVLFSQERSFTLYYETCENCNTANQTYSGKVPFSTSDITSDFGRRRSVGISNWHRGIDYNNSHDYFGDHLFSLFYCTIS